jgi:hypothetical protein
MTPLLDSRFATRFEPVGLQVLRERADAVTEITGTSRTRRVSVGLPSSSTTSTRSPSLGCCSRENCRYRGLADTALPGDDHEAGGGQEIPWIQALRRHLCAD